MTDAYYRNIRQRVEAALADVEVTRYFGLAQLPKNVAGIIAIGKYSPAQWHQLKGLNLPLVAVDQDALFVGVASVVPDFHTPLTQIVAHFKAQGGAFGMIAGQEATSDGLLLQDTRTQSFKALAPDAPILTSDFTLDGGYDAMTAALKRFGKQLPTAWFAANDQMAIGAIKALQEHHIKVPEQVEVVGFNDIAVGRFLTPSLSSVTVDQGLLGQLGAELLQAQLDHRLSAPIKITVPSTITLRGSSRRQLKG